MTPDQVLKKALARERDRRDAALYRLIVKHRLTCEPQYDGWWQVESGDGRRAWFARTLSTAIRRAVRALEKR